MLAKIFYSKTASAVATWLAIGAAFYALIIWLTPQWFGQLTWPERILTGIGLSLATALVFAVVLALGGFGWRQFRPLPVSKFAVETTETALTPARTQSTFDPPQPDFRFEQVVERVRLKLGASSDSALGRFEYERRLNLEITDRIKLNRLTVWARYANFAVRHITQHELESVVVNSGKLQISISNGWKALDYSDVQFVKAEIDKVWPAPDKGEEQPKVLSRAKSAPAPAEERPPLKEAHRGHCKQALIELGNFLNGDLTNLHEDLTNAGNSENLRELKPSIAKFHARAIHAHNAAKNLEGKQWTWLNMMGGLDLKLLIEALGELQKKIGVVKQAVGEGHHEPALMLSVKPMQKQNLEVGKLGEGLIKAVEAKDAEFFSE
jgi:hypothetical protein